jgi:tetratricopeptide (TPR) repeat protein
LFYFKLPGWIFILGLLPVANIWATNSFLQDRYLYFASMGMALTVSPIFIKFPIVFWVAMTFYITRTYMYSRHLKDDERLYRENWRNHPKSDYAVNNLAFFLIQRRRYLEAQVVCQNGLEIDRGNKMLWYNLGVTWAAQGHFNNDEGKFRFLRALECWRNALILEPRWSKPANDMQLLINILKEKNVLVENPAEAAPGVSITIPKESVKEETANGTIQSS